MINVSFMYNLCITRACTHPSRNDHSAEQPRVFVRGRIDAAVVRVGDGGEVGWAGASGGGDSPYVGHGGAGGHRTPRRTDGAPRRQQLQQAATRLQIDRERQRVLRASPCTNTQQTYDSAVAKIARHALCFFIYTARTC